MNQETQKFIRDTRAMLKRLDKYLASEQRKFDFLRQKAESPKKSDIQKGDRIVVKFADDCVWRNAYKTDGASFAFPNKVTLIYLNGWTAETIPGTHMVFSRNGKIVKYKMKTQIFIGDDWELIRNISQEQRERANFYPDDPEPGCRNYDEIIGM